MRGGQAGVGVSPMRLTVATWNVWWAGPRSWRTPEILSRIDGLGAEVICLTETRADMLSSSGYTICSQLDYGYGVQVNRRKALLWSKEPWEEVDDLGHAAMPSGRFIAGVTGTTLGRTAVVGVCIPWAGSRSEKRRGSARKRRWEDHEQYLVGLTEYLKSRCLRRIILMGDFNQRIGSGGTAPQKLRKALEDAFPRGMSLATSEIEFQGKKSIDHIALSRDLSVESVGAISNVQGERKLSDHFGVVAEVSVRDSL